MNSWILPLKHLSSREILQLELLSEASGLIVKGFNSVTPDMDYLIYTKNYPINYTSGLWVIKGKPWEPIKSYEAITYKRVIKLLKNHIHDSLENLTEGTKS